MPIERNHDRELGALTEAINGIRREIVRDRELTDQRHDANTEKLDALLDLKPVVEESAEWIETEGKRIARKVDSAVDQITGGTKAIRGIWLLGGAAGALGLTGLVKSALPVVAAWVAKAVP